MSTSVAERIKGLIEQVLQREMPPGFHGSTPLFESGVGLDSFDAVELITSMESHFGIEFDVDDIRPEHFGDLNALSRLVERYLHR